MSYAPTDLNDVDFLHAYIADYLDGKLEASLRSRCETLLKDPELCQVGETFQSVRGRLQLSMQSYYLQEHEMTEIKGLVQDPSVKATLEQVQIQHLERDETFGNLWRRLVLIGIAVALIGLGFWTFSPNELEFRPLEYLGYESLAMEEDAAGRLDLPSTDLAEVREYVESYPGLSFSPAVLADFGDGWSVVGATVFDYEVAKVTAIQYRNDKLGEYVFHFSYGGVLSSLPKSEQGNLNGLLYQAYANDRLNFIAWQHTPEAVSLLVGRRGTADLAKLAVKGGAVN